MNGHDPTRQQKQVRRSFGIVFQDPSLDDELTGLENLDLHGVLYGVPGGERKKRIEMLIDFVGLGDRKKNFVKEFSGGMKRRLEVARALLHKPRILFSTSRPWDSIRRRGITSGATSSVSRGRKRDGIFHDALHGRGRPRGE